MSERNEPSGSGDESGAESVERRRPSTGRYGHPFRRTGWRRLVGSFRAAFTGLAYALATQPNLRIHFVLAALVILVCTIVKVTLWEASLLVICIGVAITAEVFNTSIEALVDFVSPGHDDRARVIKDLAAAAVLITAGMALVVGILILGPKLWAWVSALLQ